LKGQQPNSARRLSAAPGAAPGLGSMCHDAYPTTPAAAGDGAGRWDLCGSTAASIHVPVSELRATLRSDSRFASRPLRHSQQQVWKHPPSLPTSFWRRQPPAEGSADSKRQHPKELSAKNQHKLPIYSFLRQ